MTLLCTAEQLGARRALARGALAPLAISLAADLDRLLEPGEVLIPKEKARLTRQGGRCPRDQTLLAFDPRDPRHHRCPRCGNVYDDDVHYRWWIMNYQLWLAERAVHAAALWAVLGREQHRMLAELILSRYAERYLDYPNVDNVLGPARPFFSTYLESIWLLQLSVALDLVEMVEGITSLGARVRERIVEPSARLIASFNEGASNRQVWNSAALAAAGHLLHDDALTSAAYEGPGGLLFHLQHGLLEDGTWYEGENYHLFAHRGLWYLVTMATNAGVSIPSRSRERFDGGFAAPFLTALPDFTFPARRDSQYGVSLRQWRIAESAELGLARAPSSKLLQTALTELYRIDIATGDTARWRSSAEAEQNVPAVRLTRADLGWKSLLNAVADRAPVAAYTPESALLEGQGFGVVRRERGRIYVALDYGESGGGHGHPDRLNLWLVDGDRRVLEDVGTGSYVDPSLHWYRSTLAHNAPLVDGHSQTPVNGRLRAWEDLGDHTWISADASIGPGVDVRRSAAVLDGYLVDLLEWSSDREITVDLPVHADARVPPVLTWVPDTLHGGDGLEDGFDIITRAERALSATAFELELDGVRAWVMPSATFELWRCLAPGPPGSEARWFYLVRSRAVSGSIASVWSWSGAVHSARLQGSGVLVSAGEFTSEHQHIGDRWRIETQAGERIETHWLDGHRPLSKQRTEAIRDRRAVGETDQGDLPTLGAGTIRVGQFTAWADRRESGAPRRFHLARESYRRTEATWEEAGSPEALVSIGMTPDDFLMEVAVRKPDVFFAPERQTNPLDNEPSDTNSDGLQLYVGVRGQEGQTKHFAWIMVPDPTSGMLRVTPRAGASASVAVRGDWQRTADGYVILARLPRNALGAIPGAVLLLDVIVNEMAPGRERRRGQLALSGARGEWAYLRGDRREDGPWFAFRIPEERSRP